MPPTPGQQPRRFRVRLKDGTDLGVVDEQRIRSLVQRGVIEADDLVQRVGSANWRRADVVAPALFAAAAPASAVAPPGPPGFGTPDWGAMQAIPSLPAPSIPVLPGAAASGSRRALPFIIGGALLVLVVAAVVVILILSRDNWEGKHGRELLELCHAIVTEVPAGTGPSAAERASQLVGLLGDRELEDPVLRDAVARAREAIDGVAGREAIEQARSLANEGERLRAAHSFEEAIGKFLGAKNALALAASHGAADPAVHAWIDGAYLATKQAMESDPQYRARKEDAKRAEAVLDQARGFLHDAEDAIAKGKLALAGQLLGGAEDALVGASGARGADSVRDAVTNARKRLQAAMASTAGAKADQGRVAELRKDPAAALRSFAECLRGNLEAHDSNRFQSSWYALESSEVVVQRSDEPDEGGKRPLRQAIGMIVLLETSKAAGRKRHRVLLTVEADLSDATWAVRTVQFLDPNEPAGTHAAALPRDQSPQVELHVRKWAALCPD